MRIGLTCHCHYREGGNPVLSFLINEEDISFVKKELDCILQCVLNNPNKINKTRKHVVKYRKIGYLTKIEGSENAH